MPHGSKAVRQDCLMKKINRKNRILGVLACIMLIAMISTAIMPAFATESEDQLEEVKEQQEEAKTERAEVEERLLAQQAEVERLNSLVYAKQAELDEKQVEIDAMIEDITAQRNSIDERKGGLCDRLRSMYKKGSVGFLDVLLSSTSFSEFLSNLSLVQIIYRYDQETLDELEKQYDKLKVSMAKLGEAKAAMEVAQAELESERNNAAYAEAQLEETLSYIQERIASLEAEQAEIEAIIAEEQRKAAEAAAAAAAAAGGYVSTGGDGTYIWPVSGPITSYFGYRELYNVNGVSVSPYHGGIDIAVPTGTPVHAAAEGVVSSATGWRADYGYGVFINHPNGTTTAYAHNSSIVVSPGEYVAQGQVIAYAGSTGWSLGPHVHFEIFVNGVRVDPMAYL